MPENENPLAKFNIPSFALGRAGDALARLIGAPLGALATRLERGEAVIQARTDGQAEFQRIVARSAAEKAVEDPAFMQRAMETFGRDLVKKQLNKEAVAALSVKELEKLDSSEKIKEIPERVVDEDWLNHFGRYAENASSTSLRERLSKVFAGEVKKPGSYSLTAIRTVAEMTGENLSIVKKVLNHNFGNSIVFAKNAQQEQRLSNSDLVVLQGLGLITGLGGILSKNIEVNVTDANNPTVMYWPSQNKESHFRVMIKQGVRNIKFGAYPYTSLGLEIVSLTGLMSDKKLAQHLKRESSGNILEISLSNPNTLNFVGVK